ncbi:excitatory amino acid transporter 3-like isoform X2 [Varroa jacobsoni]|uniref:excitatory amino acid transporter 3-like isoform X2 n=1 Tax=Varroa jacobsoni TaxID=62625 RepID=UPI000BF87CA5|nr:excitatory amino acid transporter 3-like isoform X2 [Varroa jacobsoni]XP_022704676.1 excitatory amino acid transporter 3-like isoform X2 [Varroa jacobsoni]
MKMPIGEKNERTRLQSTGEGDKSMRGGYYRSTGETELNCEGCRPASPHSRAHPVVPPTDSHLAAVSNPFGENDLPSVMPAVRTVKSPELDLDGRSSPDAGMLEAPSPDGKASTKCQKFLRQNRLTIATIAGVVLGIIFGCFFRRYGGPWSKREVMYINFPGEIFLRMLRGLILPLITTSMIAAVGGLDATLSGKIGFRAVTYYFSTTLIAIILGIVLVITIQPGAGDTDIEASKTSARLVTTADTLMDLIRNAFPPNIIEACINQFSTIVIEPENATGSMYDWDFKTVKDSGTNVLGLIVFCIALGTIIGRMGESGKPLLDFFTALSDAMMLITKVVVWLSPVGVMFLVMSKVIEMKDFSIVAGQVGMYTLTVILGLLLHGFIVLPAIYMLIMRQEPFTFLLDMLQAITTAFGTASSSATLPVTIAALEDKVKIDPKVVRFCIPIGATINMDGTALYEAVAAIFIAQVRRVPLDVGKVIAISITATAASIGAAGIPQAGLVTMVMVLNAIGLPADDITLIIVVDWFLDRFRTAINVLGDAVGATVVEKLSLDDLRSMQKQDNKDTDSKDTVITAM